MLLAVATINDRSLEKINTRIRVDGGGSERPSPGKLQARADAVGMASVIFEEGVEVPPDLVVEIVSDTSVEKDTVRLPQAYHAAGVREFWL